MGHALAWQYPWSVYLSAVDEAIESQARLDQKLRDAGAG